EVSTDQWIDIPGPVLDVYRLWRPTPLYRATRLEQALHTPAHIYFKYEGTSPAGSHKGNTAVAQAYYNKQAGIKRLSTETGAGQWGSALAMACSFFGLECKVYMVNISYQQKPYRRSLMQTWGASVVPSPSPDTNDGRTTRIVAVEPESCPSLTRGEYLYDFGDTAQTTPLLRMYTLGHDFIPPGIHAGGLRYHAMAPLVSSIYNEKLIEARAVHQVP